MDISFNILNFNFVITVKRTICGALKSLEYQNWNEISSIDATIWTSTKIRLDKNVDRAKQLIFYERMYYKICPTEC